jgi:hypothetical protein
MWALYRVRNGTGQRQCALSNSHIVIVSEAKDLLSIDAGEQQVLRFAQDDNSQEHLLCPGDGLGSSVIPAFRSDGEFTVAP